MPEEWQREKRAKSLKTKDLETMTNKNHKLEGINYKLNWYESAEDQSHTAYFEYVDDMLEFTYMLVDEERTFFVYRYEDDRIRLISL